MTITIKKNFFFMIMSINYLIFFTLLVVIITTHSCYPIVLDNEILEKDNDNNKPQNNNHLRRKVVFTNNNNNNRVKGGRKTTTISLQQYLIHQQQQQHTNDDITSRLLGLHNDGEVLQCNNECNLVSQLFDRNNRRQQMVVVNNTNQTTIGTCLDGVIRYVIDGIRYIWGLTLGVVLGLVLSCLFNITDCIYYTLLLLSLIVRYIIGIFFVPLFLFYGIVTCGGGGGGSRTFSTTKKLLLNTLRDIQGGNRLLSQKNHKKDEADLIVHQQLVQVTKFLINNYFDPYDNKNNNNIEEDDVNLNDITKRYLQTTSLKEGITLRRLIIEMIPVTRYINNNVKADTTTEDRIQTILHNIPNDSLDNKLFFEFSDQHIEQITNDIARSYYFVTGNEKVEETSEGGSSSDTNCTIEEKLICTAKPFLNSIFL